MFAISIVARESVRGVFHTCFHTIANILCTQTEPCEHASNGSRPLSSPAVLPSKLALQRRQIRSFIELLEV